ncbi:MAG TPA: TatD family hydrolase, partial [Pseudomonadales bacterium]|nr:TatD family hydrolase [Pseudomonadales bacterium]
MWVDSHCHLDHLELDAYDGSLDAAMEAARVRGVQRFLCVNVELETFERVKAVAERYEDVYCSVGVHPIYQESMDPTEEDLI